MSACVNQVLASYNDGMTPDEIAEDQDLEVTAIKAILMQSSSKYRKDCQIEAKLNPDDPELNFNKEQLGRANQVIYDVMLSARLPDGTPDYRMQFKAAEYIRDDVKGRKTPVRNITNGPTFNLLQFNQQLEQARLGAGSAKRSLEQSREGQIVDVQTVTNE
jgi:hypothetical protein